MTEISGSNRRRARTELTNCWVGRYRGKADLGKGLAGIDQKLSRPTPILSSSTHSQHQHGESRCSTISLEERLSSRQSWCG